MRVTGASRRRAATLALGAFGVTLGLCLCPRLLAAQRVPFAPPPDRFRPAFRADAIVGRDPGAQLGGGVVAVVAYNLRLALDAGIGGVQRAAGWNAVGRADLLARWVSDPFREAKWGLNAGGGVGLQFERSREPRPVAIVTLGVEGPSDGRWVPGVEVGLGGGVRAGVTLRRAPARRR